MLPVTFGALDGEATWRDEALMREETFGPVIPVMAYGTKDEALALANDGEFGLSGAVIAGSASEAAKLGERMDAGAISLQDAALTIAIAIMRDVEKNSFRFSGMCGSRMGPRIPPALSAA